MVKFAPSNPRPIVLVAHPPCILEGRIITDPWIRPEALEVIAVPHRTQWGIEEIYKEIRKDGTFRISPLLDEFYDIHIKPRKNPGSRAPLYGVITSTYPYKARITRVYDLRGKLHLFRFHLSTGDGKTVRVYRSEIKIDENHFLLTLHDGKAIFERVAYQKTNFFLFHAPGYQTVQQNFREGEHWITLFPRRR